MDIYFGTIGLFNLLGANELPRHQGFGCGQNACYAGLPASNKLLVMLFAGYIICWFIKEVTKMKIAVIGYSGSGKSTLSRKMADYYNIPVLFLDTVNFLPNWAERELEESKQIVWDFMQNESWVIDGKYRKLHQDERLKLADKIIFMNFRRITCLLRAYKRYIKYKNATRESMAEG